MERPILDGRGRACGQPVRQVHSVCSCPPGCPHGAHDALRVAQRSTLEPPDATPQRCELRATRRLERRRSSPTQPALWKIQSQVQGVSGIPPHRRKSRYASGNRWQIMHSGPQPAPAAILGLTRGFGQAHTGSENRPMQRAARCSRLVPRATAVASRTKRAHGRAAPRHSLHRALVGARAPRLVAENPGTAEEWKADQESVPNLRQRRKSSTDFAAPARSTNSASVKKRDAGSRIRSS